MREHLSVFVFTAERMRHSKSLTYTLVTAPVPDDGSRLLLPGGHAYVEPLSKQYIGGVTVIVQLCPERFRPHTYGN